MNKILNILTQNIGGECCKSQQYCHEGIYIENDYDDKNMQISYASKNQGETDTFSNYRNLKEKADVVKKYGSLFRYFLDGSRKTYKIDDIVFSDNNLYPIIAGQIGVGCCERVFNQNKQLKFKPARLKQCFLLSLPENASKDGGNKFFSEQLLAINNADSVKKRNIFIDEIQAYSTRKLNEGELYENRGIAVIQNKMIELEKLLVDELVKDNLLTQEAYLLKDGSLEYSERGANEGHSLSILKNNYSRVIGVSKSFNPYLATDKRNKSIANAIAKLPSFHRTPVYRYQHDMIKDTEFGVWYVRVHKTENMLNPLDGVLKVEKILTKDSERDNGLNSDEVDNITAHLINERSPSCYGIDKRWANHLYPIYLTEKYIKSKYLSDAHFLHLF